MISAPAAQLNLTRLLPGFFCLTHESCQKKNWFCPGDEETAQPRGLRVKVFSNVCSVSGNSWPVPRAQCSPQNVPGTMARELRPNCPAAGASAPGCGFRASNCLKREFKEVIRGPWGPAAERVTSARGPWPGPDFFAIRGSLSKLRQGACFLQTTQW